MRVAVILARSGSKRIPKKNYRTFCGKPMIYWVIKSAKNSKIFDKIEISTDSQKILNISKKFGVVTHQKRPKYLSGDFTTIFEVVKYELKRILKTEKKISHICCIIASAPFITPFDLRESFFKLKRKKLKFIFPAKLVDNRALRSFKFEKLNHLKAIFNKFMDMRTQDLPKIYHDAGQFYWGTKKAWLNEKNVFTKKTSLFFSQKDSVDIDTMQDWKKAEKIFKSRK